MPVGVRLSSGRRLLYCSCAQLTGATDRVHRLRRHMALEHAESRASASSSAGVPLRDKLCFDVQYAEVRRWFAEPYSRGSIHLTRWLGFRSILGASSYPDQGLLRACFCPRNRSRADGKVRPHSGLSAGLTTHTVVVVAV
jgi:hypothetical protein